MTGRDGGAHASSLVDRPTDSSDVTDSVSSRLVRPLLFAAVAELVLLRLLTRTAVHIPGLGRAAGPYAVISEAGRLAYYVAAILLVLVLLERAALGLTRPTLPWPTTAAVLGFLGGALAARAGVIGAALLATLVAVSLSLLLPGVVHRAGIRRAWPIVTIGNAFLIAILHSLLYPVADAAGPGHTSWLLLAAEALALTGAIAAPLVVGGRRDAVAVWSALVVAVVVASAMTVAGSTFRILLLWNFGLGGYLPAPLYVAAAGGLTYAIVAARRRYPLASIGLALLVVGGIGLHSTYQTALFIAGLLTVADQRQPLAWRPRPDREPSPSTASMRVGSSRPSASVSA